jgi:hypothetical protein
MNFSPWYCDQCQVTVPATGLSHWAGTGEHHSVRQTGTHPSTSYEVASIAVVSADGDDTLAEVTVNKALGHTGDDLHHKLINLIEQALDNLYA